MDEWSRSVEEHGFAVIPEMLAHGEIASLLEALTQVTLRRSRAGVRHALRHSAVAALARDSRLLAIAQEVLDSKAFPFRATLFDKSPHANWLVVWHQDTALPLRERREAPGWGPWSVKEGVIYAHAPETRPQSRREKRAGASYTLNTRPLRPSRRGLN